MDHLLTNSQLFPSFFQALPNYQTQCLAIVQLLRHYNWTWIGVITSDDDVGEKQSQELKAMAATYDICVEYIIKISETKTHVEMILKIMKGTTSQVIVLCGKVSWLIINCIQRQRNNDKTYIIPAGWLATPSHSNIEHTPFYGSLVFSPLSKTIPEMKMFIQEKILASGPDDCFMEYIQTYFFYCMSSDPYMNNIFHSLYGAQLRECNRTLVLGELAHSIYRSEDFRFGYLVYKSVYAMAHSLHDVQESMFIAHKNSSKRHKTMSHFLRRVSFLDPTGENVHFNEKREMTASYDIFSFTVDPEGNFFLKHSGHYNTLSPEGNQITINNNHILWKNDEMPVSTCSAQCPPGYRRVLAPGIHKCCFHCLECSEGEISMEKDSVSCQKCPEDQWPNDQNQCTPKPVEYLSYKYHDRMVFAVSSISVYCMVKTSIILGIFTLFRDTPVVRANNQTLSFILLVSIMLSFLCVFMFLGRPTQVTCMLRQTSFGIIFSVAISSILAKTIMVYMAFKATKPGSSWRKYIGVKITNCVVFLCSSLQVLLSIIWLSTSPPFPERNTHLYQDKIIFQRNEGSMLAFSMLLGYLGLLAAVSFIVAFLARNLPDSYNEAQNITFSMLVVCSVWGAFIPAYMSVTGKNTVLVEIFAVIASSAGILACIFFPKCYIILVRPELNMKSNLTRPLNSSPLQFQKKI